VGFFGLAGSVASADPAPSLSVAPATGLTDGQTVAVTTANFPVVALAQLQISECANAYANLVPITTMDPSTDCEVVTWINGPNGTVNVAVKQTGIGTGNRSCITPPDATYSCYLFTSQAINENIDPPYTADIEFAGDPTGGGAEPVATTTTVALVGSPVTTTKPAFAHVTVATDNSTFAATGPVTVTEDSTPLGSALLSAGQVDVPLGTLSAGTHHFVAHFPGDGSFAASDSDVATGSTIGPDNISVGDVSVVEGDSGARMVSVPVVLSQRPGATISMTYTISGASLGTDYTATHTTGLLVFKAKQTVRYVTLKVLGNTTADGDRSVSVSVSSPPVGWELRRPSGTVTILDDDATPATGNTVAIAPMAIPEGDSGGPHAAKVELSLGTAPAGTITVVVQISAGTAKHRVGTNGDWSGAIMRTLTFSGSQVARPVLVPTFPDTVHELDETVILTIVSVTGPAVPSPAHQSATLTILTDE
jgi:hypothetical protein